MDDYIEEIERFLADEMSVREQYEFEEELRKNPELRKEYVLRKDINDAIKEKEVINLRGRVTDIIASESSQSKKTNRLFLYSSVAAVFVLLIVVGNIFFNPFQKTGKKELLQTYYQVYPSINNQRSSTDRSDLNKELNKALNLYDESRYRAASKYFSLVLERSPSNALSQFYLAICYIENEKYSAAEEYLHDLILKQGHLFWEQSHWYLAMVYLKQDRKVNLEDMLERIIQENMTYKDDAKKLLRSIR